MEGVKLSFMCVCFCLCIFGCSGKASPKDVFDVIKTSIKLYEIFKDSDEPDRIDNEDKFKELEERISSSIDTNTKYFILSEKLDSLEKIFISIRSSLTDIENISKTNNSVEREEYAKLFVKHVDGSNVIPDIRFLPERLTYSIPGTQDKIIDLLADKTRCNMTALDEFRKFYYDLLSQGMYIDLVYTNLSLKHPLNSTISDWDGRLKNIPTTFKQQQDSCKRKFPVLAQEDLNNAIDADTFWSDNKQRYTWKTSDIMFLNPCVRTHQFLYHKSIDNHLFCQQTSTRNIFAVFNDINETLVLPDLLVNVSEAIKSSIGGKRDKEAALHVGLAVEKLVNDQNLTTNAIVVFFEGGDLIPEKIHIDDKSPGIQLVIEDVKLSHRDNDIDGCSWLKDKKELSGKMKVFAYLAWETGEKPTYQTGSSSIKNNPLSVAVYLLLVVLFRIVL